MAQTILKLFSFGRHLGDATRLGVVWRSGPAKQKEKQKFK